MAGTLERLCRDWRERECGLAWAVSFFLRFAGCQPIQMLLFFSFAASAGTWIVTGQREWKQTRQPPCVMETQDPARRCAEKRSRLFFRRVLPIDPPAYLDTASCSAEPPHGLATPRLHGVDVADKYERLARRTFRMGISPPPAQARRGRCCLSADQSLCGTAPLCVGEKSVRLDASEAPCSGRVSRRGTWAGPAEGGLLSPSKSLPSSTECNAACPMGSSRNMGHCRREQRLRFCEGGGKATAAFSQRYTRGTDGGSDAHSPGPCLANDVFST
ncbi:hypothetical protein BS50DRAFT_262246 [Corynespora cassiicola Philippines]|uniref:Uncharacterized protein n=1 Tax=Corynespora cassiicola Philippines TaxID=1448308 RepID=A0A2T2N161_CORCC|nr:hypothetical protein BS50DRAFT_262246 [Corynespora cassiicola Philippines]